MKQGEKRDIIVKAALKRFAHFGVDKTTMNEIADDLSLSKASLYYYFPDKLNLYAAVLQSIISAEEEMPRIYLSEKDPLKALSLYLDGRTEFIILHYNILEYLKTIGKDVPKELEPVFTAGRLREVSTIAAIISKIPRVEKPKKLAELLLNCFDGIRASLISPRTSFFPDKKQFLELAKREKELAAIFIKGLQ